jgi:hypothetical protein
MMVNPKPGGGVDVFDAAGNPMPSPPPIFVTTDDKGNPVYSDPWGNRVPTLYPPPGTAPAIWPSLNYPR